MVENRSLPIPFFMTLEEKVAVVILLLRKYGAGRIDHHHAYAQKNNNNYKQYRSLLHQINPQLIQFATENTEDTENFI